MQSFRNPQNLRTFLESFSFLTSVSPLSFVLADMLSADLKYQDLPVGGINSSRKRKEGNQLTRKQGAAQCFCAAWHLVPLSPC